MKQQWFVIFCLFVGFFISYSTQPEKDAKLRNTEKLIIVSVKPLHF